MKHEERGFSEQLHIMNVALTDHGGKRRVFFGSEYMWTAEVKLYPDAPHSFGPDPRSGAAVCSAPAEPGLN